MKKIDYRNGSIAGNILSNAMPMMVAQLIALTYNIVDRIYIGRIPETGTISLAAVGLCYAFVALVTGFTNMYGMGGAPLFSIELGRGNRGKAGAILNTALRLELLTAAVLTVVFELGAPQILRLFGAGDAELVYALPYIRIYLLGTVFTMTATGINPYINAQGYAVTGMCTVLIGAVANIVLDPLFIFVFGMGVAGAAIATVIAQLLSALFVLRFLFGDKNEFHPARDIRTADPDAKGALPYAWDIISLGISPFVMQFTYALVSITANQVLMATGGQLFVSAMTVINSVRQILDTPITAITEGATPTLSFNYGARRPSHVRKAILFTSILSICYTALMWLFIEREPLLLLRIFTDDAELQQLALRPLHLYFFAFVFQSFQYCGQTVFKALNKKQYAVFFSIFRKVILVVPLTVLLAYAAGLGTDGVFIAEPVSNVVGGSACVITMLLTVLPELKRMEKE